MTQATTVPIAATAEPQPDAPVLRPVALPRRLTMFILAAIAIVSFAVTVAASRHTSTTFDEIIMVAGGARGYETGRFDISPEHPPLTLYMYGLPVYLDGAIYPPEPEGEMDFGFRYRYSRAFFWRSGNDPERVALLGRLPAAATVVVTVLLVFAFTASVAGPAAGLLAAGLVGFLPDVLAHGGVAYNDLPLAASFVAAIWAFDRAARRPGIGTAVLAGLAFAIAIAIKFSAVALLPIALAIVVAEAIARSGDRVAWLRRAALAMVGAAVAAWLVLAVIYRGDFLLEEFRYGLDYTFGHVTVGHGAPAYLLGRFSVDGWWYFFPVAFFFKTPAALHLLALLALLAAAASAVRIDRHRLVAAGRKALNSPLRGPVIGLLAFGGALLTSNLNIGFRYALPALPLLCMIIAVGCQRAWQRGQRGMRVALIACTVWYGGSVLAHYPNFLSYISEYGPGQGRADLVLLDSSVDWGQGLVQLRRHLEEAQIDRVYLSYFGSGDPAGYGIEFVPLASFFPLEYGLPPDADPAPVWVAISATNLHGVYLPGDPFANLRTFEPDAIIANSIFLYRINE